MAADATATENEAGTLSSILALGRVEKAASSQHAPQMPLPQMVEEQLEMVNTFTQLRQEEWEERRQVIQARAHYEAERELMVASDLAQAVVFEGREFILARRQVRRRQRREAARRAVEAGIEASVFDDESTSSSSSSSRSRSPRRGAETAAGHEDELSNWSSSSDSDNAGSSLGGSEDCDESVACSSSAEVRHGLGTTLSNDEQEALKAALLKRAADICRREEAREGESAPNAVLQGAGTPPDSQGPS
mmetsp:Transcript_69456/g.166502  ORF Transcript_69456/g.166502 Transcript_69456/m.166502 type:complete len:248 (+) Transcript_69456:74-817(+)